MAPAGRRADGPGAPDKSISPRRIRRARRRPAGRRTRRLSRPGEVRVQAAGIGHHPQPAGPSRPGWVRCPSSSPAERGAVGGEPAMAMMRGRWRSARAARCSRPARSSALDSSAACAVARATRLVMPSPITGSAGPARTGRRSRGKPGQMQGGPEPVARPGEVPAGRGGVQAGVDAAEQHPEQRSRPRQHVGRVRSRAPPDPGCPAGRRRPWPRGTGEGMWSWVPTVPHPLGLGRAAASRWQT